MKNYKPGDIVKIQLDETSNFGINPFGISLQKDEYFNPNAKSIANNQYALYLHGMTVKEYEKIFGHTITEKYTNLNWHCVLVKQEMLYVHERYLKKYNEND